MNFGFRISKWVPSSISDSPSSARSAWLDRDGGGAQVFSVRMSRKNRGEASFTIIEILVVVTIIGMLVGLSVPAVGGALASAKRAKVAAMAQQIRTAVIQFQTEYGYFPTNGLTAGAGTTGAEFALVLTGSANATADNPRRIVFLEVPKDFTRDGAGNVTNDGIVTPRGFYKGGQSNLSVAVDQDYDGQITAAGQTLNTTVAVWFTDPRSTNQVVGTWK